MSTYLVTGIAGFIGSSLARAILAQGDNVRGVDNFSTGKRSNIAELLDRMDVREVDLLDLEVRDNRTWRRCSPLARTSITSCMRLRFHPFLDRC